MTADSDRLAAIGRRWSRYGGMGNERSADDYTDAGCRILAVAAFEDVPWLLEQIRQRDKRIAAPDGAT